jgi:hypothetical protein
MSKMSEFPVITDPAGFFVPLFTPESGGLNRRGLIQKLGLPFVIAQSGVAVTKTGSTAESILAVAAIPGGSMGPNGSIRIRHLWANNNDADSKTRRVRFGSVADLTGTQYSAVAVTTNVSHYNTHEIVNRNSQASQVGIVPVGATGGPGGFASAAVTSSVNTALDSYVVFSGELASGADSITLDYYSVEVLYRP